MRKLLRGDETDVQVVHAAKKFGEIPRDELEQLVEQAIQTAEPQEEPKAKSAGAGN